MGLPHFCALFAVDEPCFIIPMSERALTIGHSAQSAKEPLWNLSEAEVSAHMANVPREM